MILVDTSIWIDHLHQGDPTMAALLNAEAVVIHPFVLGEIALGSLRNRSSVLSYLSTIPGVQAQPDSDVMTLIETRRLHGSGIGYVDAHLLCATMLAPEAVLWTRDRRLQRVAEQLGIDATTA